jgi:Sec-independent protein translocase protein TatA
MFALTGGELAMVSFLFALVWGAGLLPRLGERLGERLRERGGASGPERGKSDGS